MSAEINHSVTLIASMFAGCLVVFGALVFRLLTTDWLGSACRASDAETSKDRAVVSVKVIGLAMVAPVALFLITILGELPLLVKAFPLWSAYMASLFLVLFCLVALLFYVDREDVENYTIDLDRRSQIEPELRKRRMVTRMVGYGFGLWTVGMALSLAWLLHLSAMTLHEMFRDF